MRIMSMVVDEGGCGWYRIRQPLAMIKEWTEHDTHVLSKDDDMVMVAKALENTDIMVVRQGGEVGVPYFKKKFPQLKFVLDIDDNMEEISPYSEHYGEYGTKNVKHYDQWLWKDGVNNFDIKKNQEKINSLISFMRQADMVTVTTEKLAEYARRYSTNVKILPNCVNMSRWWKLPLKVHDQIRVGWSGGISHYEDWFSIKEVLNQLMREYEFTLVMVGTNFEGIVDKDNRHLVEYHDWTPFLGHSYRMMCMDLDFAIIPLADLKFNHYKSSIKLAEMSAMGVPSVVADILPYSSDIKEKKEAFWSYKSPQQFKTCVLEALTKPLERRRMGKMAYEWVKSNYDAKKNVRLWTEAYSSLL